MAFKRGTGSVQVELARLQSWTESTDVDLYGAGNGDLGVIREHRDDRAERVGTDKFVKKAVGVMGAMNGILVLIKALEMLHIIPK